MTSRWYCLYSVSNVCKRALACSTDNRSTAVSAPLATHPSTLVFNFVIWALGTPLRLLFAETSSISTGLYRNNYVKFAQHPVQRTNLWWRLLVQIRFVYTSLSGTTTEIHILNKMQSIKLFNAQERSHWWTGWFIIDDDYDDKQIRIWTQVMGWGSAV